MRYIKLFKLIFLASFSESSSNCPYGWTETPSKCLKIGGPRKRFNEANKICKKLGGELFYPENADEAISYKITQTPFLGYTELSLRLPAVVYKNYKRGYFNVFFSIIFKRNGPAMFSSLSFKITPHMPGRNFCTS